MRVRSNKDEERAAMTTGLVLVTYMWRCGDVRGRWTLTRLLTMILESWRMMRKAGALIMMSDTTGICSELLPVCSADR